MGIDDWKEVSRKKFNVRSNADHTRLISTSIFVMNFLDITASKDLWEVCKGYGVVVDVYIPNRKSKAGKRPTATGALSFASVLRGIPDNVNNISTAPAMVLADDCVVTRNLDNFVMGEVKDFSSINNLHVLLSNEGFHQVKLAYLGGLWIMIQLVSVKVKSNFLKHVGVASWFKQLCNAQPDFVSRERVVWVDIEGVPLHAWSRSTFIKIGSRWGEVLELEENKDDCFARKRICIKTKKEDNILEKFKIIVRGKVFVLRAKELFVWSPMFKDLTDDEFCSDDDSVKGDAINNNVASKQVQPDAESDVEGVSDTCFGDQDNESGLNHLQPQSPNAKEKSSDPFNLYDLLDKHKLNKQDKGKVNSTSDSSIPYPPGFTPENAHNFSDPQKVNDVECHMSQNRSNGFSSRIMEDAQPSNDNFHPLSPGAGHKSNKGGSILEVLDDMVKVGQSMGFSMEGCLGSKAKKAWIKELNNKHKVNFLSIQETKTDCISDMDIRVLWGNHNFDYTISEAVGNSGGILCVWDPSIFRKEQHITSDNFVALYGSWIPTQTKLLMVSVYAPQSVISKRSLWDYISFLINRWNGDCMLMGDFNEVRCLDDRMGSIFNVQGANEFNSFISNSGLVEIQLEGYSFTWSHPSASHH
ncbi:RNA-directed DNA polymerase, eukaryota [Tanacetum coccineum]